MMFFRVNVYAFAALYLLLVKGQTTHTVTVGLEGSFYNPAITSALLGDTIIFEFVGDIHTVTQSSFENPCSPLPGGFNSGPAGTGGNSSVPVPKWSLVITNVTGPIWFFCAATRPMSHCNTGMVGAINPPSIPMFNQFQNAAKMVTGTPAPTFSVTLTGQGAFATNPPTAAPASVTPSPSSTKSSTSTSTTSTSSTTSTPPPTQTSTTSTSTGTHLGAIVGGSVGGGIALIALLFIFWSCCIRKRKAPVTQQEPDDFFRYNPVPVRRPSEVFAEAKRTENITHNASITSNTMSNNSGRSRGPEFSPVRPQFGTQYGQSGTRVLEPPTLHRQPSAQSDLLSSNIAPSTTGHSHSEQPNNLDVRALAQEIAAVLYQGPPALHGHQKGSASQDMRGQMTVQNLNHEDSDSAIVSQIQPPPNYHAATGPRGNVRHT